MAGRARTTPRRPRVKTTPGGDAGVSVSEAEIAAIGGAINKGEVAEGNLASSKASNADVKAFAAQMVTEHTATLERQRALFSKLGITPKENDVSRALTAKADTASLSGKTGADFDTSYIDIQVATHAAALIVFDTKLIPAAVHQEIKADRTATRASVQMHLEHAQSIRAALGSDAGVKDGGHD